MDRGYSTDCTEYILVYTELCMKKNDLTSSFQAGLGLLDGVGQIRVFTPRRGRYPFEKSEKPPRPVPALSFEPQTNQALSLVA